MKIYKRPGNAVYDTEHPNQIKHADVDIKHLTPLHQFIHPEHTEMEFLKKYFSYPHIIFNNFEKSYYYVEQAKDTIQMKIQIGNSATADFEENTWTFEMPDGFAVAAGDFAIIPKETYDEFIEAINFLFTPGAEISAKQWSLYEQLTGRYDGRN